MSNLPGALQQAVFTRLSADAALALLVGSRLYDDVPRTAVCPYVTLSEMEARDRGTKSGEVSEVTLTLHVWSAQNGMKETQQILAALRALLHNANLTLSEGTLSRLQEELSFVRRLADGRTRQGVARYRAVVSSF